MEQKYNLTDIGNALSRVMDNPMTKIIRSGSIGVLGVVNPVAGIVGGIGNDLLSEYNTFKLGHLLSGLSTGFNIERGLNELYNYVNSSPEKAIIVANLFKQTVNAECPKVCVIYGLILASHLEIHTEFTHEELIVCKALENATDYDLKNFKDIMENYLKPTLTGKRRVVFPNGFADVAVFSTTCDWCVYNRIFVSQIAEWGEMEDGVLDMTTYYYEATPASVLLDYINAARNIMEKLSGLNRDEQATILMVTHDSNAASFCKRILFIQDGVIFHELRRGDESRQEFYGRILKVMAQLGGGSSNVL